MIQYKYCSTIPIYCQILLPQSLKNQVLKLGHVLIRNVKVSQWVVVCAFFRIVIQNLTIGVVKRTLKTLARTELFIVLENYIRHKNPFQLNKTLLYSQNHLLSNFKPFLWGLKMSTLVYFCDFSTPVALSTTACFPVGFIGFGFF